MPAPDLQSHSRHSDGELPPAEVVERAARAGVGVLALTDHDTIDGVDEALDAGRRVGVRVLAATEISAVDAGYEDLHVLGYGIDHHDPLLRERLAGARQDREARAERMVARLRELGLEVDDGPLRARREAGKPLGRPHLAAAVLSHPANSERLAAEGADDVSSFIRAYLIPGAPAYSGRSRPTVAEAIEWIHDAGGVAVWAHPFWDIDSEQDVLAAIDRFAAVGLDGVEAFYVTHTGPQTRLLADRCAELGLLSTASSDFHGPDHGLFSRFLAYGLHDRAPRLGAIAAQVLAALVAAALVGFALAGCGSSSQASQGMVGASPYEATAAASAYEAAAAANAVTVSPLPGTGDASPASQISFLGGPGTQAADVSVVGSRSGSHSGRLEAYSTGTGASFLPSRPFVPGERVTVRALAGAGTANQPVSTTFTIAHQATVSQKEFPNNPGDPHAVQRYATLPGVTPASVRVLTPAKPGAAPGYLFLAPYQGQGTPGPMIAEQDGGLVWFHPLPAGVDATNFQVQQYQGRPVLTWWQGRILEVGFGQGEDVVYDSSYRPLATIRAGNGYHADLHEIRLTPQGTAWIDIFDPIHMNLSSVHGSSAGVITDSVVQEIDVRTGLVMWEWHALGHIPIGESHNPAPPGSYPWDYLHINSADPGSAGDVLLSARNTWTLYDVNIHSGAFNWRLGDRRSSFRLGPGTRFYWQHDAEFQPGGLISVFDNGSDPPKERQSRGLLLRPDTAAHTVSLVRQFTNPSATLLASSQGNTLSLPGGNWLLGYGGLPNLTEFDSAGHVLLDATLGRNVQDFRTYLSPWNGQPTSPPSVAVQTGSGGTVNVLASWNGATGVASWRVIAGASPQSLVPVASAPRSGFETSVRVSGAPYFAVQALDGAGAVLGTSPAVQG